MSAYLDWIRTLECTVCGSRQNVQAAHMRGLDKLSGGMGLKPDDLYVIPLCAECHGKEHTKGRNALFDARQENMLLVLCGRLWGIGYGALMPSRVDWIGNKAINWWRNRYMRGE